MDKLVGVGIITLSTILYGALNPLFKKGNQGLEPFTVMAISTGIVFVLALIASIFLEHSLSLKTETLKNSGQIILVAGIVNFLAFWLSILGFKYMNVWQQDMFYLLTPVVAGILAYFLLGEKISANLFIGLLIMGVGLYIAVR